MPPRKLKYPTQKPHRFESSRVLISPFDRSWSILS